MTPHRRLAHLLMAVSVALLPWHPVVACARTSAVADASPEPLMGAPIVETPPAVGPRGRHDDTVPADLTEAEREARARLASSATRTGVIALTVGTVGGTLLAASGAQSGGDAQTTVGMVMFLGGMLAGPSLGWAQAGYPDAAITGVARRMLIVAGSGVVGIAAGSSVGDWEGLGIAVLTMTVGATLATAEGFLDCGHIGRHVRAHGAGGTQAAWSPITPVGPGLAVSVPLH